jgi:hypothetical protein
MSIKPIPYHLNLAVPLSGDKIDMLMILTELTMPPGMDICTCVCVCVCMCVCVCVCMYVCVCSPCHPGWTYVSVREYMHLVFLLLTFL